MQDPTHDDILAYAKAVKGKVPSISEADLRNVLRAKFLCGKDVLPEMPASTFGVGFIYQPLPWMLYLKIACFSLWKVFVQDKSRLCRVQDEIDKVMTVIRIESMVIH